MGEKLTELALVDIYRDILGDKAASNIYIIPLSEDKIKKSYSFWDIMCCGLQKTTIIFGEDVTSIFKVFSFYYKKELYI
jgi:hypothetical protein